MLSTKTVQAVLRYLTQYEQYSENDNYNLEKFKCTKADIIKVSKVVRSLYGFDKSRIKLTEVMREVKNDN